LAGLKTKKCILTKENTRRRRFRFRKNNEADKTSDPIQSNPIHGWIQSMSNSERQTVIGEVITSRKPCCHRQKSDAAVIFKNGDLLHIIEPETAPFDPPTLTPVTHTIEPNAKKIGSPVTEICPFEIQHNHPSRLTRCAFVTHLWEREVVPLERATVVSYK